MDEQRRASATLQNGWGAALQGVAVWQNQTAMHRATQFPSLPATEHEEAPRMGRFCANERIVMIEVVLCFAVLLTAFEFVVLSMIPPKYRLRLLGSRPLSMAMHWAMLIANLYIHWGTVTGTMAATGAFVTSMFTVEVAKIVYGTVVDNRRARRGIVGYRNEELVL